jgi:predicted enzyme related to lactoylglutathione lyase
MPHRPARTSAAHAASIAMAPAASSHGGRCRSTRGGILVAMAEGEIRYVQIPAADAEESARFYETVFGWSTRTNSAGGEVASPATPQQEGEAIATFRDPAGNVLGIFHEGGR